MKKIFKLIPVLLISLMACGSDEATPSTDNNSNQTSQNNTPDNKIENGGSSNTTPTDNQGENNGGNSGENPGENPGENTENPGGNTENPGENPGGSTENPSGEEDPIVISLKYPSYLNEMAQSQSKVGEQTSDGYTIPYDDCSFYVKISGDNATLVNYNSSSLSKAALTSFQFPNYVADKDGNWIPVTVLGDGQQAIFKEGTYFGEVEVPENVTEISDNSLTSLDAYQIDLPTTLKTVGEKALGTNLTAVRIKSASTTFTNLARKTIGFDLKVDAGIADAFALNNKLMTIDSDSIKTKTDALSKITTSLTKTWIDFSGYIRDAKASAIRIDFTIDFKNKQTIYQAELNGKKSTPKVVSMDYNSATDIYTIIMPRDNDGRYQIFARYNDYRQPICYQGNSVLEITEVNKLGGIRGLTSSKTFDFGKMTGDSYKLTYTLGRTTLKFLIKFMNPEDFVTYASSKEESGSDTPTLPVKPGKQ